MSQPGGKTKIPRVIYTHIYHDHKLTDQKSQFILD